VRSSPLSRLRYPSRLRQRVRAIVREHMFDVPSANAPVKARRFLHRYGDELAFDLVAHKRADLLGKREDPKEQAGEVAAVDRFRDRLARELTRPHRLDQLAVDGNDLIAAGWAPGPRLGDALEHLLGCVIGQPALNTREWLLAEAERLRG
jgi:tRNA nucleotidyltransferase (CCA-adding enzyme)